MLQRLWLLGLALMFMPDLSASRRLGIGTLQPSDYVLLLLLPALLIGPARAVRFPARVRTAFWLFLGVALLSSLAAPLRYPGADPDMLSRELSKLAKFAIYALIGPLVARRILSEADYRRALAALAVGGLIAAGSLLLTAHQKWHPGAGFSKWDFLYEAANALSVTLAALICAHFGLWYTEAVSPLRLTGRLLLLLTLLAGLLVTGGRGGWLAAAAGLLYVGFTGRPTMRSVVMAAGVIAVATAMVVAIPQVKGRVDRVFDPTTASQGLQGTGYSDEGRLRALSQELPKLARAPFVGVGFFNRDDPSGLDPTGSHNFFAQMALETGLLGLWLLLWLLWGVWRVRTQPPLRRPLAALHATIIAICLACLTGEYLYGGLNLMLLSVVYSCTLALSQRAPAPTPVSLPSSPPAVLRSPAS